MQFGHRIREHAVCAAYLVDALPANTEHGRNLEDPDEVAGRWHAQILRLTCDKSRDSLVN